MVQFVKNWWNPNDSLSKELKKEIESRRRVLITAAIDEIIARHKTNQQAEIIQYLEDLKTPSL